MLFTSYLVGLKDFFTLEQQREGEPIKKAAWRTGRDTQQFVYFLLAPIFVLVGLVCQWYLKGKGVYLHH
jgi:hypothetical protein